MVTDCQRCAGNLQYTIATYDVQRNLVGLIQRSCEPCINTEKDRLVMEMEFVCAEAAQPEDAWKALAPARGIFHGAALSIIAYGLLGTIIFLLYLATH